jgi:CHASE2 domain-containing sensor protein
VESRPTSRRLLAGVAASLIATGALLGGALDSVENASIDARYAVRHTAPVNDIVIVAIDDYSIQTVGNRGWPFRRLYHARAVDRLHAAGARQIVYDVQFTEPSARQSDDLALFDAIGRAGGATLATTSSTPDGSTDVLGGEEYLAEIDSRAAAADLPNDDSAVIRRYPARAGKLPSIAVVAAQRINGHRLPASAFDDDGSARIDFRGGLDAFPTVSFANLVAGRVARERLRGKIVLVGSTAPTLQDSHATATSGSYKMPGVEVQAHALWTAMHGNPLRDAPPWLALVSIALLGLAVPLVSLRLRPLATLAVTCGLAAVAVIAAQVAFAQGLVVALAGPLLALGLGALGTFIAAYLLEGRRRRRAAAYSHALELEVAARTRELRTTQLEVLHRLSQAAEQRDNETGLHLRRMSLLCGRLARAAGIAEADAEEIEQASLLHDVGKIGIPDEILHKPGRLTADERAVMQRHAAIGADLLSGSSSQLLRTAESIARTHHERWDGTGYPAQLVGEAIPLAGRIAAICDVYDALLTERPYKAAWTLDETLTYIESQSEHHFDPRLVDCFIALIRAQDPLAALMGEEHTPVEPELTPA